MTKRPIKDARGSHCAPINLKQAIAKIERHLRRHGWSILSLDITKHYSDDPEAHITDGFIDYSKKAIVISKRLRPRRRLYTLLHEAGHALAHKIGFQHSARQRTLDVERQATFLGEAIACYLRIPLGHRAWLKYNWEARLK